MFSQADRVSMGWVRSLSASDSFSSFYGVTGDVIFESRDAVFNPAPLGPVDATADRAEPLKLLVCDVAPGGGAAGNAP